MPRVKESKDTAQLPNSDKYLKQYGSGDLTPGR
jgi:hypothetical protein